MEYDTFNDQPSIQFDEDNDFYFTENMFDNPFTSSNTINSENDINSRIDSNENEMHIIDNIFSLKYESPNCSMNSNIPKRIYEYRKAKQDYTKQKVYIKRKIILSHQAQNFKNDFYLIFTKKKKFPKTIIKKMHKLIQEPLKLKSMTREIIRFNDKYFEEYASDSFKIIQYLVTHKEEILSAIPELKDR